MRDKGPPLEHNNEGQKVERERQHPEERHRATSVEMWAVTRSTDPPARRQREHHSGRRPMGASQSERPQAESVAARGRYRRGTPHRAPWRRSMHQNVEGDRPESRLALNGSKLDQRR